MATIQLTLLQQAGEPVGDGGDQYAGLDRFGRLVDQRWLDGSGADVERVQYGYDRASNRVWRANPVATALGAAQDEFYSYDGLQQLSVRQQGVLNADRTGISHLPAQEEDFTYDPLGNWSEYVVQAGGGTTLDQTRTHNVDNEITTLAGDDSLLGYDQAGNMTTCPQPADGTSADALTWDAWNRLVAVESTAQVAGNSFTSACLYDGLTRRVSKTITVRTGHTATVTARDYFYSDQWKVLQDQTTARRPQQPDQRQFVWRGCAEDKLILRDQGGAAVSPRLFALDDGKNVTAVCDDTGAVAERYGYSGFGTPVFMDAGFTAQDGGSSFDWETLFCGYRFDADTGLYQVRYRFLHPQLGRWLSRDPLGEFTNIQSFVHRTKVHVKWKKLTEINKSLFYLFRANSFPLEASQDINIETIELATPSLYSYAENEPITSLDGWGLWALRCRPIESPVAAIIDAQHCWVSCNGKNYSLLVDDGGIATPQDPNHDPDAGLGKEVNSGDDKCDCIANNFANNPGTYRYDKFNANSNWFANSLLKCCDVKLGRPHGAVGWNKNSRPDVKFTCCDKKKGSGSKKPL